MNPILQQNQFEDDTCSSSVADFFHTFNVGTLFSRSTRPKKGVPAFKVLKFLFALVFLRKSFFEMTQERSLPWSKDTFYRFLSDSKINWRRFLLLVAKRMIDGFFRPLTKEKGDRVLVLDDSPYYRDRSKKVELLSKCYDHSKHTYYKGYRMLGLCWSDGRSTIPLSFSLLGSAKEKNRLFGEGDNDGRTSGGRRRKEAVMTTPDAALSLLDSALANGVEADWLLFDSWFATNSFLHSVQAKGIGVIAMVKDFNGMQFLVEQKDGTKKRMKLGSLYEKVSAGFRRKDILGSVLVEVDNGKNSTDEPMPVKVVFVRNRTEGAKRQWLAIVCTDVSVSDEEIVRIYGKRWSIEVFFKACKSVLHLAKEFQTRSYDSLVAHTSIVFLRYMMLSFEQRRAKDDRAYGELFLHCCEELEDISFQISLSILMDTLKSAIQSGIELTESVVERLFREFITMMPSFMRKKLAVSLAFSLL